MAEALDIDRPDLVAELDLTLDEIQTLVSINAEDTFAPVPDGAPPPPDIPDLPKRATVYSSSVTFGSSASAALLSPPSSELRVLRMEPDAPVSGTIQAGSEHGYGSRGESTPPDRTPLGPDVAESVSVGQADFVLEELIARGGQGEVWRARQPSLDRDVALKILPVDRSDRAVVGFLQEAYTSAALDHPYIVPVHELGSSVVDGRAFHMLALKLVRGAPWHEQMRTHRRAADFNIEVHLARHLPIFLDLCHAVAYSHAKHIIHRDLKPRQVVIGDFGEVYLLDWGLAISLVDDVPPVAGRALRKFRTRATATNRSGTPAYMAPEQTHRSTDALGYHTDIYLLGGVLYEIVCGRPPHRAETATAAFRRARSNAYDPLPAECPPELVAVIEQALASEPARRPAGVHELRRAVDEFLTGAGRQRESRVIEGEARASFETLPGRPDYSAFVEIDKKLDLALARWPTNADAIELREETRHRYAAVALDSGDLQLARSLALEFADEPARVRIQARTAEAVERLRSHVAQRTALRRLIAAMVVVAAFGVLTVLALWSLGREARLRAEEQARLAELFRRANQLNSSERLLAEELSTVIPFPDSVLPGSDRESTTSLDRNTIGAMGILKDLRRERAELEMNPMIRELLSPPPREIVLGEANLAMSRAVTAADALVAFELYRAASEARADLIQPLTGMGIAAARAGFPTSATVYLGEATQRTTGRFGPYSSHAAVALALQGEASRLLNKDSPDYARYYRESLQILEPQWADLSLTLADRARSLGEYELALRYSSPTLALLRDSPGTESRRTAEAARMVGASLSRLGRFAEADPLLRSALALKDATIRAESPERVALLEDLAANLSGQTRFAEAERTLQNALEISLETNGEDHPITARVRHQLATTVNAQGRFEEADALFQHALDQRLRLLSERHPDTAESAIAAGENLARLGRIDEADRLFRLALQARQITFGDEHPDTAAAMAYVAAAMQSRDDLVGAEGLHRRALSIALTSLDADNATVMFCEESLASCLVRQRRYAEALPLQVHVLAARLRVGRSPHRDTARAYSGLAVTLSLTGRAPESRLLHLMAIAEDRHALGDAHPDTIAAVQDAVAHAARNAASGDPAARSDVLTLGCWLEGALWAQPNTGRRELTERWLGLAEALTSASLAMEPPRTQVAIRLVRRAAAVAQLLDLPPDAPIRASFLAPRMRALGLAADTAIPIDPDLWPDHDRPIETSALLAYLDGRSPPVSVAADLDHAACDPDDLAPRGEELASGAAAVLDALSAEFGVAPARRPTAPPPAVP